MTIQRPLPGARSKKNPRLLWQVSDDDWLTDEACGRQYKGCDALSIYVLKYAGRHSQHLNMLIWTY